MCKQRSRRGRFLWIGGFAITFLLSLGACLPGPGPDRVRVTPAGSPVFTGVSPPPTARPTAPILPSQLPALEITGEASGSGDLSLNPTLLPEPHLVQVLDWEQVTVDTGTLCAGCAPDRVVLSSPRGLDIAVVQVYSRGGQMDAAAVTSDLAFAEQTDCQVGRKEGLCGLIFGQVRGGVLTLIAQHVAGDSHQLTYLVTFQRWADYESR